MASIKYHDACIRAFITNGATYAQLAEAIGASYAGVYAYCRFNGLRATRAGDVSRVDMAEAVTMFRGGMTFAQIAATFKVTRQRVQQILAKHGIRGEHGGARRRRAAKDAAAIAKREAKCQATWGMSLAERAAIDRKKVADYKQQRRSAWSRGLEWHLSLREWIRIWDESGKWALRGRGKGRYCLARFNDKGPYAVGNVWVCLNERNASDARAHAREVMRHDGTGNIHYLYPGTSKPWLARHGHKYLGVFATQEEALAAKQAHMAAFPAKRRESRKAA